MPHPGSGDDWIEIYNSGSSEVNIQDWSVADSTSVIKTLSGILPANSFLSIDLANRLNNGGDTVILKSSDQNITDQYSYTLDTGTDISFGRVPDAGVWEILASSSKGQSNGNPNPSVSPSNSPSASATPSPPVSPSPSPSASISSTPIMNFSIQSDTIDTESALTVKVNLSYFPAQTSYYIKGAFFKEGSANYFAKTLVNGTWVRNLQTYSSQFQITTDSHGSWQGDMQFMIDKADSGFTGPGDYKLKIGRYTNSGQGPYWSSEQTVIIAQTQSTPTPSPSSSSSASNSVPETTKKPINSTTFSSRPLVLGAKNEVTETASASSLLDAPLITSFSKPDPTESSTPLWISLITILTGSGLLLFSLFKHPTIAKWYGRLIQQNKLSKWHKDWLSKFRIRKLIEQL